MTTPTAFPVRGKRVVVMGAARSGVAIAELLVRRGATVTRLPCTEKGAEVIAVSTSSG